MTIEIRNGRIAALHEAGGTPLASPGDEIIDAAGLMAVPGLVNAHYHSPDNLIRGSAPNLPLELWSLHSAAGRERRKPREIYISALLGAIEMVRTGTTTVLDHVRISPDLEAEGLDAVARAYADAGLRAVIAPVVADRPLADTLPFDSTDGAGLDIAAYGGRPALPATEQIALVEAFLDRWHGAEGRLHGAIGPSGPQRCSDALLERAGELSRRRDIVFHTHVLETEIQRAMGHRLYGKGIVRHLADLDLLGRRTNLVHAIWLDDGDSDLIGETQTAIIHNPVSNARLGSGYCRLPELLRHGVRVGLGTDSACCNDSNNLLETAKWASILHNLQGLDPDDWVTPEQSLTLATAGGADAIGLGAVTGRIAPGYEADITLLRLASPAFVPLIDPVRQLILAENGSSVDRVLVAGRTVAHGGRCTTLDEDSIWAEARELAAARLKDNRDVYRAAALLDMPIRRMRQRIHHQTCGCHS